MVLTIFAIAIEGTFYGLYYLLWEAATEATNYDQCLGSKIDSIEDNTEELSTEWTFVYALNTFLYLGLSVFTIALLIGAWVWPLRVCGFIGHCCGSLVHIGAIVTTGVMLYRTDG